MSERVIKLRSVRRGLTIETPDTKIETFQLPGKEKLVVLVFRGPNVQAEDLTNFREDLCVDGRRTLAIALDDDTDFELLEEVGAPA